MAIRADDAQPAHKVSLPPVTLGWFLKRTLLGIAILLVAMGGLAWLTYASIDPDADTAVSTPGELAPRVIPVEL